MIVINVCAKEMMVNTNKEIVRKPPVDLCL